MLSGHAGNGTGYEGASTMGEYATRKSDGERVKIGTCEDMYYLRHDQRGEVEAIPGNLDPTRDALRIRFRFPFPDEDHLAPGAWGFTPFERRELVWGIQDLAGFDHHPVSYRSSRGDTVSLPCPESVGVSAHLLRHYGGPSIGIAQQKMQADGVLATVVCCTGCNALARLTTWADAEPIVLALRTMADDAIAEDRDDGERGRFLHAMADRVQSGYVTQCPDCEGREALCNECGGRGVVPVGAVDNAQSAGALAPVEG